MDLPMELVSLSHKCAPRPTFPTFCCAISYWYKCLTQLSAQLPKHQSFWE